MFNIIVGYPNRREELDIMKRTTSTVKAELDAMLSGEQIMRLQDVVRQVVVADHVFEYAADLVRATRPREPNVPKFVPELIAWGAGPRASQYLILGGKARAILHGRLHVTTDDIRTVAYPVLRHRIVDVQRRRRGRQDGRHHRAADPGGAAAAGEAAAKVRRA
jgi:MoxR-like ATPase